MSEAGGHLGAPMGSSQRFQALYPVGASVRALSLSNQLPYNKQTLPWQAGNKPLCEESVRSEGVAAPKTRSRVPPCVSTAARRAAPRWPACKLTGPGNTAPVGSSKREEITCREQNGGPAERQLRMQCIAYAACAFTICENSGSTASQGTHHFGPPGVPLSLCLLWPACSRFSLL